MNTDPFRRLTRGVVEAVPNDPEFQAMRSGQRIIPTTWGNLASKLVEDEIVEADPQAVADFLVIDRTDLVNPRYAIKDDIDINDFFQRLNERIEIEYRAEFGPKAQHDANKLDENRAKWTVSDTQDEIEELDEKISGAIKVLEDRSEDEYWLKLQELRILQMQRKALRSGVAVKLPDFAADIIKTEGLQYFSQEDIVASIANAIDGVAHKFSIDRETPARNLVLGAQEVNQFFSSLHWMFDSRIRHQVEARWDVIEGYLYARPAHKHPILTGTEK